jgi:hypothetical protein
MSHGQDSVRSLIIVPHAREQLLLYSYSLLRLPHMGYRVMPVPTSRHCARQIAQASAAVVLVQVHRRGICTLA